MRTRGRNADTSVILKLEFSFVQVLITEGSGD